MPLIDKYKDEQRRAAQEEERKKKEQAAKWAKEDAEYEAKDKLLCQEKEKEIEEVLRQTNLLNEVTELAKELGLEIEAGYGSSPRDIFEWLTYNRKPDSLYNINYCKEIIVIGEPGIRRYMERMGEFGVPVGEPIERSYRCDLRIQVEPDFIIIYGLDWEGARRGRPTESKSVHYKNSGFSGWREKVIWWLKFLVNNEKTKKKLEKLLGH